LLKAGLIFMVVSMVSGSRMGRGDARKEGLPFVSVVIPNYNGEKLLPSCLRSIRKNDYPKERYEVLVMDNNSTDGSVGIVRKDFPWATAVRLEMNFGNTDSINRAVELAKGDCIVVLDNDTEVDRMWLSELVRVASSDQSIGICGSRLFNLNIQRYVGEGTLTLTGIPDVEIKHRKTKECFFVSGCSLLIKREVLSRLEFFFDPTFFAYFEDVDLCWRAKLLGYKTFFVYESVVLHKKAQTASKWGNKMKFYHYRNKIRSFKKNLRFPLFQTLAPILALNVIFAMATLMIRGGWEYGVTPLLYFFEPVKMTRGIDKVPLKKQIGMFFGY
jgi:GT2 family glycosyltransferase